MKYVLVLSLFFSSTLWAKEISLMAYNVENLFDTIHDEGKDDYTYLPKIVKDKSPKIQKHCRSLAKQSWIEECLYLDWSDEVLDQKMTNLARVITSFNPDILVLEEVENLRVLKLLLDKKLKNYGYKYVSLLEGEDARGIDNGVISKFPIVDSKIHQINIRPEGKYTRGILEVQIQVEDKTITVFANHWPSQGTKNPIVRQKAAKALVKAAQNTQSNIVVAVGDFNVVPSNDGDLLERIVEPHFFNARKVARGLNVPMAEGTHWFAGEWGPLDKIYVFKKMKGSKNTKALYEDFHIVKHDFMLGTKVWTHWDRGGQRVTYKGVPLRFDVKTQSGYSDHLPITMKFNL